MTHTMRVERSRKVPGLWVGICTCGYTTMLAARPKVDQWTQEHLALWTGEA